MKLKPEQLKSHLSNQLLPVYLINGDEALLVQESCDEIRKKCRSEGFTERLSWHADRQFDWNQLLEEAGSLSLFGDKKIIEIRIDNGKPGDKGSKAIDQFCQTTSEDTVLLIITGRLDASTQKRKWVTAIDKVGAQITLWPVSGDQLPGWIQARSRQMGLSLDKESIALLTERVEGNLLAAKQELEKLALLCPDGNITAEQVTQSVADSARFDIFNLTDECIKGVPKHALHVLQGLKSEGTEPPVILWALTRDLRVIYELSNASRLGQPPKAIFSAHRVISKRQNLLSRTASRVSHHQLNQLIKLSERIDQSIKGNKQHGSSWELLAEFVLLLSGQPSHLTPN
ncbi:DNA polymerase III subunit delta [Alkalimarinus sediminis]|uniref:DNA polymerase III subunit delta n=1 Tax=Alkalimarinus sediminis TaxID=1632866 RepID=A0A9E8HMC2_9ALTE|nr:DNA polymerase III subunit delta [Alkalimarinus sediminis]UZW75511.1 DNA polymerase III subunit delta [Alkalimarinus sediminis]